MNNHNVSPVVYRLMATTITLLVPILLIMISVRLVMTETYLWLEYNKPDFLPDFYGLTREDRLHWGPYALQYVVNNAGIEYLSSLKFSDGQPLYQSSELQHMVDVQQVYRAAMGMFGLAFLIFAVLLAVLVRTEEGRAALRVALRSGGLLTLTLLAGVVLFILLNWQAFFDGFHTLFFEGGTWVFNWTDTLIRLYPPRFWEDAALTVGGLSALGAVGLIALSVRQTPKKRLA